AALLPSSRISHVGPQTSQAYSASKSDVREPTRVCTGCLPACPATRKRSATNCHSPATTGPLPNSPPPASKAGPRDVRPIGALEVPLRIALPETVSASTPSDAPLP